MKIGDKVKERISMIIFVLIIGSILTTALVAVDFYTAPRIGKNKVFNAKKSILAALDIPYTESNIAVEYRNNVMDKEIKGKMFYFSQDGSIAFRIAGSGLWGPISGILALSPDLKSIRGITIIHQEETPGLGDQIGARKYLSKFRGKNILPQIVIGRARGNDGVDGTTRASIGNNTVDGISGATMSSKAFEKIINNGVAEHVYILEDRKR